MTATETTPPPPRRTARRILVAALAVVAIVVAADALLYRWATAQLEKAFTDWAAARTAQGWTVAATPPRRSGWPLAARIAVNDVAIFARHQDLPGGLSWTTERLTLRVTLLHPRTLVVSVAGAQHLRAAPFLDIPFTADRFEAVIPLQPGVPAHIADLNIAQLRAGIGSSGLTLAHLRVHGDMKPAALQGEPALALSADAAEMVLPARPWALGPRIGSAALDLTITGPMPHTEAPLARATAWRDGGGTLELRRVAFDWGPMRLDGSATLALDERLQPMGAATARIAGYVATLDALATAHMIGPQAATAAKAVLGLMAHPTPNGGPSEVEVPLTLKNGALAVGRIPLGHLPELSWPDAP